MLPCLPIILGTLAELTFIILPSDNFLKPGPFILKSISLLPESATAKKSQLTKYYLEIKNYGEEKDYIVEIGKANILQEGQDLTLISWGSMIKTCEDAINQINNKYSVELIDLRTINPYDSETIIKSVKKTGRCIIVHEAPKTAGFAAELIACINEKALLSLEAPVIRVTGYDVPYPLYKLENYYLPDIVRVIKAIDKAMRF